MHLPLSPSSINWPIPACQWCGGVDQYFHLLGRGSPPIWEAPENCNGGKFAFACGTGVLFDAAAVFDAKKLTEFSQAKRMHFSSSLSLPVLSLRARSVRPEMCAASLFPSASGEGG